ncbi:hypothetical protein P3X46_024209 [Hevea brasiliensis]|uniref:Pectinesterase n=1 Tax=Hevea brasiliensis TaxID=3981 RepID=A0ABQ9L1V7_HEVBR|nr:pectinesterase-like [Hevea brasiliensis]KAJ9158644.1 hypothetical protein P3X46_024209 [Hevea brasiliensis]
MITKVIVSIFSLILIVCFVIGMAGWFNEESEMKNVNPHIKFVHDQVCEPTNYKESCAQTLESINSTDRKEIIKATILAASDAVKQSIKFTKRLEVKANSESRTKMALDDCQELLENAMQELQVSYSLVNGSDLSTINERSAQLQSWLSSVLAYQETCVDNFEDHSIIKPLIRMGMIDASHRIDNALAILSTSFNVPKSYDYYSPQSSRRLLSVGDDGYPTWFSASDRKLLALQDNDRIKPNAVVAQDDSGQFVNISAALSAYPKHLKGRYVIYVKAGIYHEHVTVTRKHPNVFIYGDGPKKTIVIGKKSFASGVNTWRTATFVAEADGLIAKSIGFANTAGLSGRHAVALRVDSDMSAFFNCRMDGYQNTLLYQAKRQFYRNCVISGTIDFIFGYGAAVIQNSLIIVRRPRTNQKNTVTADGRKEEHATTGLVIHNCRIVPEKKLVPHRFNIPTHLGRPWKPFSRTIVMESQLADFIQPEGWMAWAGFLHLDTLYYAEYANTGPGANTNRRVRWKNFHVIDRNEAHQFTAGEFLHGAEWIKRAGVPVLLGLRG